MHQNRLPARSWCVNATSMAASTQMRVQNQEALDEIFRAHYERVARVIGRVIHDQARAEEIAVEIFLKWWRTPRAHGEHAEGWLYRASVRKALDELRSQTRRKRFDRLVGLARHSPPTPEQLFAASIEQERVRAVLGALNPRHAEILLLRSEDLTYQQIAVSLGINPNSLGSLIGRAEEAFRKEYVKRYGNK
jgi:RNA polymerase sigma-70 factor, ECF subfamily